MDVKKIMADNARALAAAGLGGPAVNAGVTAANTGPSGPDVKRMSSGTDRRARAAAEAAASYERAESDLPSARDLATGGESNLPAEAVPLEQQSMEERRKNAVDLTKDRSIYDTGDD